MKSGAEVAQVCSSDNWNSKVFQWEMRSEAKKTGLCTKDQSRCGMHECEQVRFEGAEIEMRRDGVQEQQEE